MLITRFRIIKSREETRISTLFFIYSIILILPGIFYGKYEMLYNIFFYGRFIIFAVFTSFIFLGKSNRANQWDLMIPVCWIIIGLLYLIRSFSVGSFRGILFGTNILFHLLVLYYLLNTRKALVAARKGMIWGASVLVMVSLIVTIFFPSFQIVSDVGEYRLMRAGGLLNNAQQLTPYVIVAFIYLMTRLISRNYKLYHIPFFISAVFMGFLTGSRTAYFVMLVVLIVTIIMMNKKKSWLIYSVGILIICISIFVLLNEFIFSIKFDDIFYHIYEKYIIRSSEENLKSFGYRTSVWRFGIDKFLKSPLWGYGHRNIGMFKTPWGIHDEFMAHNGFLMVAMEIGIFGLISLVALLCRVVLISIKRLRSGDVTVVLSFVILIASIFENITESWILSYGYVPSFILWLSIAEISLLSRKIPLK